MPTSNQPKGSFIPFYLPFQENGRFLSEMEQATRILATSEKLLKEGKHKGVAITYSANYDQTITINACYAGQNWKTNTNDAHMTCCISALKYQNHLDNTE